MCSVTLFIVWIGLFPQTFLSRMEPTVKSYLIQVERKYQAGLKLEEKKGIYLAQETQNPQARK
jgi:hypothetical protein